MTEIYFDNSATTRPSPGACEAMRRAAETVWANPSSLHAAGLEAQRLVTAARESVLAALGVRRGSVQDIVFTSGGTESNNLALLGVARAKRRRGGEKILISEGEHASVSAAADALEREGFCVARIPTRGGRLDTDVLARELCPEVVLVSLMRVNNETGAVYDVASAFALAKAAAPGCVTHTDAVQALGKVSCTPARLGADLVSVSSHKIHGPKGAGALYVAEPVRRAKKLVPVLYGGGQESGYRSGTENVISIAGFGAAAGETAAHAAEDAAAMRAVREAAVSLLGALPGVTLHLPPEPAPHILSVGLPGIRSETMLHHLSSRGIFVSSGSACASNGARKASPALTAFGLSPEEADTTLRFSFCEANTPEQVAAAARALAEGLETLARVR